MLKKKTKSTRISMLLIFEMMHLDFTTQYKYTYKHRHHYIDVTE